MNKMGTFFLFCLLPLFAHAQAPVDYSDVGIIINQNDSNSVAIGNYFVMQRQIPARNVILIDAPAKETINPDEFADIRTQVEQFLINTGLVDTLNYLVTTKGVPLRINHGGSLTDNNASFDAEIMLVLGFLSSHIGRNTLIIPPSSVRTHDYFMKDARYRRLDMIPGTFPPRSYDLFLTTRLTGLTKEDVFALIDRSGPHTLVDKDSALFVFDRDPRPIQLVPYDSNLAIAGDMLAGEGWNVLVNHDSVFIVEQRNVLGYASWGSNDHYDHHYTTNARPRNHWLPGSIAETYVSTSARNFIPGQTSGQSRIADLFAEGCTGASGYVFEPYSIALTWVNILYDRYIRGYNLAESFYMSNPTLSWMATIVGDPKTSIVTAIPPVPDPVLDAPAEICSGEELELGADAVQEGWMNWFRGDSATVVAAGLPLDSTHALWIAVGKSCSVVTTGEGPQKWTFVNENFVGRGFASTTVNVLPAFVTMMHASADTLFLDTNPDVRFTVDADGAISWDWDFGDGGSSTDPAPMHTYTTAGTYNVRVTVSNGICTSTTQLQVTVFDGTTAAETPAHALRLQLGQNYPNPTAAVTAIPFVLPARAHARLIVTDVLGKLVSVVLDAEMHAGPHTVLWDAGDLENGVYHCVLEANELRVSRRMTIMR